jgi:hypothetical protein
MWKKRSDYWWMDKDQVELLVVMARGIWLRRNSLVFEGVFKHPNEVYVEAAGALEEFKRCNSQDLSSILSGEWSTTARQQRWQPCPTGIIKVNWDASINSNCCIGLGIVARDCNGEFLGARTVMQPIVANSKTAEAMTALWAVKFCKEVGFFYVVLEGDAAQVISHIQSIPPYLSKTGHFIESIMQELSGLWYAKFAHVHRELNSAGHVLVKEAAERKVDYCWLEEIPVCISSIMFKELACP